jgi:hypothetical protein
VILNENLRFVIMGCHGDREMVGSIVNLASIAGLRCTIGDPAQKAIVGSIS